MKRFTSTALLLLALAGTGAAQTNKGLDKYDFFFTGQNFNDRRMSIVKDGHVVWSCHESEDKDDRNYVPGEDNGIPGEISDAVWMNDNHILVAGQYQIYEVAVDTVNWTHKVVWRHSWTRPDCEVHSVMPIGRKYVVYVQCGNSPNGGDRFAYNEKYQTKLIVRDIATWSVVRELDIPYDGCKRHNLNRSCTLTPWGTFIFASMEKDRAYEIDSHGKIVNEIYQNGLWGVEVCPGEGRRLLLTSENTSEVSEYDLDQGNKKIWTYKWSDDTSIRSNPAYLSNNKGEFKLSVQKAYRLEDGTTVMTNWGGWDPDNGVTFDANHQPIQARGVDKNGKVTWELQSWNGKDYLGPATIFQLLSEPVNRDELYFGDLKGNLDETSLFYIYNVGQQKYVKTGGYMKSPDAPTLVDTQAEATEQVITRQEDGTYLIADPEWSDGWGVLGRQCISISTCGAESSVSWGTTLTPGWTFQSTGTEDYVYINYTWGDFTPGNYVVEDPSEKTCGLYFGAYGLPTDEWPRAWRNEVKTDAIYGGFSNTLAQYGDNAKWRIIPVKDGEVEILPYDPNHITPTVVKEEKHSDNIYNLQGQRVTSPTKGIYIVNGKKMTLPQPSL